MIPEKLNNYMFNENDFFNEDYVCEDPEKEPALLVVCWKFRGKDKPVTKMINPSPKEVEALFHFRMIGFNCRDYDDHILYARAMGYSIAECNTLSRRIIEKKDQNAKFGAAYKLSYADVYDFAAKKQGLKKWEIELGIHHMEMGIPWDKPAPKDRWDDIAEYCANDVLATEAVFEHCQGDFQARVALAELSGLTVNDPNRLHIIKIIVGDEKKPQLVYTDFATGEQSLGR